MHEVFRVRRIRRVERYLAYCGLLGDSTVKNELSSTSVLVLDVILLVVGIGLIIFRPEYFRGGLLSEKTRLNVGMYQINATALFMLQPGRSER